MSMNRSFWLCWLAIFGLALMANAQDHPLTYHVQLVRGTNHPKPDNPEWKPIGPELSKRLAPVFRWDHYWEVNRHPVTVDKARKNRVRLDAERELELELVTPTTLEVRLFRGGELARKTRQASDAKMSIMGGDTSTGESWFVVVRTTPPK